MKTYCKQNNGKCDTCSLVNYGRDCRNNPISTKLSTAKYDRMLKGYDGFLGDQTVKAILEQIPEDLKKELTGRQLGLVMRAVNAAYHNGKASCGAEIIDGDAIWINALNGLYELADIKAKC